MDIGKNPFEDPARRDAWDKGYKEAVLDMYVFLTSNEQQFDLEPNHALLINNMIEAVNDHERGRLSAVEVA